jgi:hypothetical protein
MFSYVERENEKALQEGSRRTVHCHLALIATDNSSLSAQALSVSSSESAGCSLLKAEGFSCSMDVFYEGL